MAEESEDRGDTNITKPEESSRDEGDAEDNDEEAVESASEEDETDEEEDGEEDEPKLKYARLTSHLGPLYRNGDATSTFLVAGDKMVSVQGKGSLGLC
jgi:hypothetical protein